MTRATRGNVWARLDRLSKVLLIVAAIGGVVALLRNCWSYMVWDVVARERCEAAIDTAMSPLVGELRALRDAVDFQTFIEIRRSHGVDLDQAEKEWAAYKRQRGAQP